MPDYSPLSKCCVCAIPNGNYQIMIKLRSSVLNCCTEPYFQQEVTIMMEYVVTLDIMRATSSRNSESEETLLTTCRRQQKWSQARLHVQQWSPAGLQVRLWGHICLHYRWRYDVCLHWWQSDLSRLHDCCIIYTLSCNIITLIPFKLPSTGGAQKTIDQSTQREMPEDLNLKCTENITRGHSNWSSGWLAIFFTTVPPNIWSTQDDTWIWATNCSILGR